VVSAPYVYWLLAKFPAAQHALATNEFIGGTAAVFTIVIAGFTLESIGSYVEVHLIDRRRVDRAEMLDEWWSYLRLAWQPEPIGQRYLRRLLVSFKFELNMSVAAALAVPGIALLGFSSQVDASRAWWLSGGLLVLASALLKFATDTSDVLARVRKELLGCECVHHWTSGTPVEAIASSAGANGFRPVASGARDLRFRVSPPNL
jgi:hypothetical protein